MTALLVLAILASSTLVFTNRVELLRLAVVLSLWAAVMAAFVTVIYRRQTDVAQARARDMKFVYDLQLDREISARREYELSVEAHLRRQLSREARAQAADEVAALRAELSSLRSQLEVMLGADLATRPALESDRIAVAMPAAPDRVESSRVTVVAETIVTETVVAEAHTDNAIIDVSEEPLTPVSEEEPSRSAPWSPPRVAEQYMSPQPPQPAAPPPPEAPWRPPEVRLGRHASGGDARPPTPPAPPETAAVFAPPPPPPAPSRGRHWVPPQSPPNPAGRHRGPEEPVADEPAAETPEPQGQHAAGQSLSDLMDRLQADRPGGGGGRRRRKD